MRPSPGLSLLLFTWAVSEFGEAFQSTVRRRRDSSTVTHGGQRLTLVAASSFSLHADLRYQTCRLEHSVLEKKIESITTIASDIDGTILGADHALSSHTKQAIQRAVQETQKTKHDNRRLAHFFPATGKSRRGALDSLGTELCQLLSQQPGVFLNGLYCVDSNGQVIFEKQLPQLAVQPAEDMAERFGATVVGNFKDEIYCNTRGDAELLDQVNRLWREPVPQQIRSLSQHGPQFHRLLFLFGPEAVERRNEMRVQLELLADQTGATVTSSYPTMLELLPGGCSKGLGVQKLCESLGVDPSTQLVAIGDNENDKEMLKMAAIGVAVGNATPLAKSAADLVLAETSCHGAAGLAMERFSKLGQLTA